jgi:hypothetical protein
MGPRKRQLLSTLYVALFALGGADSTGGFCLRTLSNSRPTTIVRHILDTVAISHTVDGTSCKELVRHVNLGLLHPFTAPSKGPPLCLLGCNTAGL